MSVFSRTEKEVLSKELKKIRSYIPEQYNQVKLLDFLNDPDVDLYFSITTRTDGKTFNYLLAFAKLGVDLGLCTCVIVQHAQLRDAMISQIDEVFTKGVCFDRKKSAIEISPDYTLISYENKPIFVIVDLNNAMDLKNFRSVLNKCSLTYYDEFLVLGGEYMPNEYLKWKMIFETIDAGETPFMKYTNNLRKAFFTGNPIDFNSEFLAHYNLYKYLESQPMNTIQKHGNIVLERRRNSVAQSGKNNRLFNNETNESVTGLFAVNNWQIKNKRDDTVPIVVKLTEGYLYIYPEKYPILSVKPEAKDYSFNVEIRDNKDGSVYLEPAKWYKDTFYKKYDYKMLAFENQYSKSIILDQYPTLNIFKILTWFKPIPPQELELEKLKVGNEERLKKRLALQYNG